MAVSTSARYAQRRSRIAGSRVFRPKFHASPASDQALEKSWGIDATPTLVVGHLQSNAPDAPVVADYRSNEVQNFEELSAVGRWLVKKEEK